MSPGCSPLKTRRAETRSAFRRLVRRGPTSDSRTHRGSEAFIRARLGAYRFEQTDTVLDVGCGRGELQWFGNWGRRESVSTRMRRWFVAVLKGPERDAHGRIEFSVRRLVHRPYLWIADHRTHEPRTVSAFFDLAFQKLKPRGILITETVNPHSLRSRAPADLTHRHPIFPEGYRPVLAAWIRISRYRLSTDQAIWKRIAGRRGNTPSSPGRNSRTFPASASAYETVTSALPCRRTGTAARQRPRSYGTVTGMSLPEPHCL
jgi:hypothetical protein